MSWKRYQNELIVLIAFLLMFIGYIYKQTELTSKKEFRSESNYVLTEIKEVIALKKIWSDKKTTQKVGKLKTVVPQSKVKWSKKRKKVKASYKGLSDKELNTLVKKILNLPIEIKMLKIKNVGSSYDLELKCQW